VNVNCDEGVVKKKGKGLFSSKMPLKTVVLDPCYLWDRSMPFPYAQPLM